jgi:intracellular multiplication protein IcmE
MATEHDAGRDTKLTWGLVAGIVVLVVGGSYFAWGWLHPVAVSQPSRVNIDRVANTNISSNGGETPAYQQLREQYNRDGAAQARNSNQSFLASIPATQQPIAAPAAAPATPAAATKGTQEGQQRGANGAETADATKQAERRQKALDQFLKRLNPDVKEKDPIDGVQTAQLLGSGSGGSLNGGGTGDASYQRWSDGLNGGARTVAMAGNRSTSVGSSAAASVVPVEVIPPYWRGPGEIDIGVDSDNSTTPVLGRMNTGRYAGAILKASDGAKLTGEGVVIHFNEMAYKGINYKVDAYALQEDSLLANVATDVNHRYMSRIVLPALLGGIGNIGEMYSQANTQLVSNGFNTQVVRPGLPDGSAVLGAVAGGAAGQAAKVLSEDAQRMPATQVTVTKGQVVAIQFMRGVYSGDAIAPGEGGEAVRASVPIRSASSAAASSALPVQPTTPEQWRAVARSQIQQQQQQELIR